MCHKLYYTWRNRLFAGSGHMVRNKLNWDANNAVGLPKQRNSYQSSPTILCFESPSALFASQCNLFRTMWPDPAKGLLSRNWHITDLSIEVIFTNCLFFVSTIQYLHHLDRKSIVLDIFCAVVKKRYSCLAVTVSFEFFDCFDIFFAKQIPLKFGINLNQNDKPSRKCSSPNLPCFIYYYIALCSSQNFPT